MNCGMEPTQCRDPRGAKARGASPGLGEGHRPQAARRSGRTLPLVASTRNGELWVTGSLDLLMTDFGIEPPTAMLGTIKTDAKVTVRFETVLTRQTS